jgi:hypothetical protein
MERQLGLLSLTRMDKFYLLVESPNLSGISSTGSYHGVSTSAHAARSRGVSGQDIESSKLVALYALSF